ncbi:hypothetical protein [Halomontanus rarus]|uniref:hypothetical protein n=1 Tax=Halomontanus rarus TaxID=3034020 RepID=UPI00307C3D1C
MRGFSQRRRRKVEDLGFLSLALVVAGLLLYLLSSELGDFGLVVGAGLIAVTWLSVVAVRRLTGAGGCESLDERGGSDSSR